MTEHTPSGVESPVDLARWDHAKWLQERLGECRAENAALVERLEQLEPLAGLWHCTMEDKAAADAHWLAVEERLEQAEAALRDVEGTLLAYWTDIPESEVQRLLARLASIPKEET